MVNSLIIAITMALNVTTVYIKLQIIVRMYRRKKNVLKVSEMLEFLSMTPKKLSDHYVR